MRLTIPSVLHSRKCANHFGKRAALLHWSSAPKRTAFTLLELMVVIVILGIIATLTTAATLAVLGRQKVSNTEWLLKTCQNALDQHWRAVVESARREAPSSDAASMAGGDARRAQAIHIKLRLKQEFPTNFLEAFAGLDPYYVSALNELQVSAGQNPPQVARNPGEATESAVCLLLALQKQRKGVTFDVSILNTFIANGTFGSVTLRQLVDAWGTPLTFYRWPAANPDVDALNPQKTDARYGPRPAFGGFQDPLDSDGTLLLPSWYPAPGPPGRLSQRQRFEKRVHSLSNFSLRPDPSYEYYLLPVIASAGRNRQFEIARFDAIQDLTAWGEGVIYLSDPMPRSNGILLADAVAGAPAIISVSAKFANLGDPLNISPGNYLILQDAVTPTSMNSETTHVMAVSGNTVTVDQLLMNHSASNTQVIGLIGPPSDDIYSYRLLSLSARGD